MRKMPLAWHERNLKNYRYFLEDAEKQLARKEVEVNRMRADIRHMEETIARAKREGRDAYDAETYNKQRRGQMKQVTAYESADGHIYPTKEEALEADITYNLCFWMDHEDGASFWDECRTDGVATLVKYREKIVALLGGILLPEVEEKQG